MGKEDTVTELRKRVQNIFLVFKFFLLLKKPTCFKLKKNFRISVDIKYNLYGVWPTFCFNVALSTIPLFYICYIF